METLRSLRLGVLLVLLQVLSSGFAESTPCLNGFDSEVFTFRVQRKDLHRGTSLGRVLFNDCAGSGNHIYISTDKHFQVDYDGTVKLKTQLTLHEVQEFSVHSWDSEGKKHTASVRVENVESSNHHHDQEEDTEEVSTSQNETLLNHPVLEFPKSSNGLIRIKRDWVIPALSVSEGVRGKFPMEINGAKIMSSHAKTTTMLYRITGEGADLPPVGLFTINRNTGQLYVTAPLDREAKAKYVLVSYAVGADDPSVKEPPMEIIFNVIDQNDNKPIFTQNPFLGNVPEALAIGSEFMFVNATDADDAITSTNGVVQYSIISQNPTQPNSNMFVINPVTGGIGVNSEGLDREKISEYTLLIQAADMEGTGLVATGTAVITVTDSNDNAPKFVQNSYTVSVPENKVGAVVVKLPVTDDDEPQTPAWTAKFKIVTGNSGGLFSISTGPNKQEGIITTVKPLDFELNKKHTLLVAVENDVPFTRSLPTSTATVLVNVQDVNEAPVFDPVEQVISKPEGLEIGTELTVYTATDPDIERNQTVTYRISSDDRAGWVSVGTNTGLIRVKSIMDRESPFVKDGKYKVLILAVDNDAVPATGTGTLVIELVDVNDNAPVIEERDIRVCNKDSAPVLLTPTDKDGPGFAAPFSVELQGDGRKNWSAKTNDSRTGIILTLKTAIEPGDYNVVLRVFDSGDLHQDSTIHATVCDCTGNDNQCAGRGVAGFGLTPILGILGAILALLLLVLLLLLFLKKKKSAKKVPLINDDDVRDDLFYYDEEGGGEDDQEYDLSVLHRGLDNRPGVFRDDEAPTFMTAPQYRPRPTNPEEIGTFIDDNLKAADNDPTAPPYDSLLVYDSEGGGSNAGSLSSLNSSSSGDQDYNCLHEWGPRFKKLADMYGGGEEL